MGKYPANIKRFPATACRHHLRGHCAVEESANPGYHERWRCILLARLEKEYDRLLTQADNFNLERTTTVNIWGGRMRGIVPERVCPDYEPGGTDVTGCRSCVGGVCVNRLPACPGVCRKFSPHKGNKDDNAGPEGA